ncbi:F-box only protein 4 [Microtus ochrogaster]|uniref:F-box only protein 4 n=1 Tax=Microtus ochrogaster TaxID=79684 RepID=A0A8J6KZI4_MICOH|nr:F-box only protein 4 [Microtus ochrogaster]
MKNQRSLNIEMKDHFLIRASAALEKLKLLCGEEQECSNPSNLLELYTQAILDMTYFEENKLVDEDFPEDSSPQKVKELLSFLSEPEILVKENNMHPKLCDLLGDELLECLSWRRGALLYMYCHSLTKRREWLLRKSNLLQKYLVDGINYLLQMLNYRCPIQLNEGVSFQDLDTAKLLSTGIFSDIHVLAMMYSGEMCYWGLKHCTDLQSENNEVDTDVFGASCTTHKEPLDFREVGEKILKKYVSIDVQLYILSFLSPHDLCQLGSTDRYWNETVRDPILWRYFLLRDLPSWSSVDWKSLPDLEILKKPISEVTNSTCFDYMKVYKMCCPYTRRASKASRPVYGAVTSFLHSLIIQNEPRFAMFGPGLEELNTSLVLSLMSSEELCPTAGLPHRQIDGIGSGVNFQLSNQHKFNILILYSTTRKERDRAREEHTSTVNKMFSLQSEGNEQGSRYSVIPQIQKVCEVVDGFIYVANGEAHKTHELRLSLLNHPWMVQDMEAETLTGFLNGIEWILEEVVSKRTK